MKNIQNKLSLTELENLIKDAQRAYYDTDEPIMEDYEFDELWDELMERDPNNSILKLVGKDASPNTVKVKHVIPMGSQQKCKNHAEFFKWVAGNGKRNRPDSKYVVQYKLDGSSIELVYENGVFIRAVTRGDGVIGDDVTSNIIQAKGVIPKLKDSFTGAIRGEVLLTHETFFKHFKDKANCRNAANGVMKRKDGSNSNLLLVMVYDCLKGTSTTSVPNQFKTEDEKISFLTKNGFTVVPTRHMTAEEIGIYRDELNKTRFEAVNVDIDGIVIKCPEVDLVDVARDRPNKQIAFKFSLEEKTSVIREVEWSISGKNRTPVAIFDSVRLNGTNVCRALLSNRGIIKALNLKIGSTVVVVKRGEIIPKIERVVVTPSNAVDITVPLRCDCGTMLVHPQELQLPVYCPNKQCMYTVEHALLKWADVNDIYGLGEAFVHELYLAGVKSVCDLYSPNIKAILNKALSPGIAPKVLDQLETSVRNITTLDKILAGMDLDDIGERMSLLLVNSLSRDWKTFKEKCTYDNLINIPGISDITATNCIRLINSAKEDIDYLVDKVFTLNTDDVSNVGKLSGKSFCFTGELNTLSRKEAEKIVNDNGGKVSSVSKNLTYLVTNDRSSSSSKCVKAKNLGIAIIGEVEFIKLVNN